MRGSNRWDSKTRYNDLRFIVVCGSPQSEGPMFEPQNGRKHCPYLNLILWSVEWRSVLLPKIVILSHMRSLAALFNFKSCVASKLVGHRPKISGKCTRGTSLNRQHNYVPQYTTLFFSKLWNSYWVFRSNEKSIFRSGASS